MIGEEAETADGRDYEAPELTDFGTLAELTRGMDGFAHADVSLGVAGIGLSAGVTVG
jgi:hypothetical protein